MLVYTAALNPQLRLGHSHCILLRKDEFTQVVVFRGGLGNLNPSAVLLRGTVVMVPRIEKR